MASAGNSNGNGGSSNRGNKVDDFYGRVLEGKDLARDVQTRDVTISVPSRT